MGPDYEISSTSCRALMPGNRSYQKSVQVVSREKQSTGQSMFCRLGLGDAEWISE